MDSTNKPKSDITLYNRAPLLSEMIKNTWSALIWVTCFFMNIDTGVYFEPIPRSPYLQYNATNLWLKIVSNKSLVWVMFAKKTLKKKKKMKLYFWAIFSKDLYPLKEPRELLQCQCQWHFCFLLKYLNSYGTEFWGGIFYRPFFVLWGRTVITLMPGLCHHQVKPNTCTAYDIPISFGCTLR